MRRYWGSLRVRSRCVLRNLVLDIGWNCHMAASLIRDKMSRDFSATELTIGWTLACADSMVPAGTVRLSLMLV
jgi:hypothetical protein